MRQKLSKMMQKKPFTQQDHISLASPSKTQIHFGSIHSNCIPPLLSLGGQGELSSSALACKKKGQLALATALCSVWDSLRRQHAANTAGNVGCSDPASPPMGFRLFQCNTSLRGPLLDGTPIHPRAGTISHLLHCKQSKPKEQELISWNHQTGQLCKGGSIMDLLRDPGRGGGGEKHLQKTLEKMVHWLPLPAPPPLGHD